MATRRARGPRFVLFFGPVLDALRELGDSGRPPEVRDRVATRLRLGEAQLSEQTAGGVPRFENQIAWARFYLVRGGYIDASERGVWALTEKGKRTKLSAVQALDVFKSVRESLRAEAPDDAGTETEDEELAAPPASGGGDHRQELLRIIRDLPPAGFERLCQRLLREAGFEQVEVTGRSGDGGIDGHGVLRMNPLISFRVLFQSKRYKPKVSVTPGHVRDFRGAMSGRADKGIIITTSTFTIEARREAVRDGVAPIELVDADGLVNLFEQFRIGLKPRQAFDVDREFFDEFRS